jgi:hypothetical protein
MIKRRLVRQFGCTSNFVVVSVLSSQRCSRFCEFLDNDTLRGLECDARMIDACKSIDGLQCRYILDTNIMGGQA